MFYSLTGTLVYTDLFSAAVSCNGIAFQCKVSRSTLQSLGPEGSEVTLYTYLSVRQDGMDLFGFAEQSELYFFKLLIGVSGVGPKAALSILSELDPAHLALAIAGGDYKALTKAQGVGPKVAQRVVLELKDKVAKGLSEDNVVDGLSAANAAPAGGSNVAETISALVMLGYSQSAVSKADPTLPTEQPLRAALKQLS